MDLQTLYYLASIYYLGTQPPYLSVSTRCTPKSDAGPCKNMGRRYFFNKSSDACEAFEYGGCFGNTNNFITKKDCVDTCKRPLFTKLQICVLQPDKGFCDDKLQRFYFNIVTNKCEKFLYGGCGGNENNFKTAEDCHKECQEPLSSSRSSDTGPRLGPKQPGGEDNGLTQINANASICTMQPEVGPCSDYKSRYYYSWLTGRCETFLYGNCGGNRNNYKSITDCDDTCGKVKYSDMKANRCALKPEWAPCTKDQEKNFVYYSPEQGRCVKSQGRGCPLNGNNFPSEDNCNSICQGILPKNSSSVHACALNPIAGICLAFMPRYFYNITAGRCDQFLYGGCQKNDNNFATAADCYGRCAGKQPSVRKCVIQPDAGPCSAHAPRYYFNITEEKCEPFMYGGCGGNENSFDTDASCMENCEHYGVTELNPCYLEPEKGPCTKTIYRYYFNPMKLRCERFIYGGCGGNRNNFRSDEECRKLCNKYVIVPMSSIARCSLQPLAGSCKNYIVRYFYNMTSRSCEPFLYRGCGGNDNNFMTMEQCQAVCAGVSYPEEIWKSGSVNFYSNWYNYYKNEPAQGELGGNDINYIPRDEDNAIQQAADGIDYSANAPPSFLSGDAETQAQEQQQQEDQNLAEAVPYDQQNDAHQQEQPQNNQEYSQANGFEPPPPPPQFTPQTNPFKGPMRAQGGYPGFG